MKVTALASGSSGNSFLIQVNGSCILIDCGLSGKQMEERLKAAEVAPGSLRGIVVSHEHSDHVKGVGVLSRKYKLGVWMNRATWHAVGESVGKVHKQEFFETGKVFEIAGLRIHPFPVPHDCKDPVGFRISWRTRTLGICTDLGVATGLVANYLTGLQVVILESNHDPRMLREGPYPWELKQRVQGRLGHLSNPTSAQLLQRIVSDELQAVILAHVSKTNNRPELALTCARASLHGNLNDDVTIFCASQDQVSPTLEW